MAHIETIAERILFLKGDVEMKTAAEVQQITDVRQMIELGRRMEEQSIKDYNVWALECGNNADAASRKVFEELVADEERHFSQFDIEIDNIARYGESYLALQSMAQGAAAPEA